MDLSEDQTASMWIYTGNQGSYGSSGDGMTFVMQNDGDGLAASAKDTVTDPSNPKPASGETLGVWGDDVNNKFTSSQAQQLAETGIQNSWALEFDTYVNNLMPSSDADKAKDKSADWKSYFADTSHDTNQFDLNVGGKMHIASAYPGDPNSYNLSGTTFSWTEYSSIFDIVGRTKSENHPYAVLNHEGAIEANSLGDGKWKHVTLNWDASGSKMTYTFDDKNPDTGAAQSGTDKTIIVDQSKLNMGSDHKIRWGFTGSTGGNFENNIVVFEQVPGLVNANATAKLTDSTQNKTISSTSDTVNDNDRMQLDYNLTYTGGRESWKNIQAKLNLPTNIAFSSAKISYANGDTQTISDLASGSAGQTVSEMLSHELSDSNASATISFSGKAIGETSEKTVAATNNSFTGSNAITQAKLTGFKVEPSDGTTMSLALTGDHLQSTTLGSEKLTKAADVDVTGKISYPTGTAATNNNITLHATLNGTEMPTQTLSNSDAAGTFTYTIPAASLVSGQDNLLELYASDTNNHSTNDAGYLVTLSAGTRELTANPLSSFNSDNPMIMDGEEMTLTPDNNWNVTVNDTKGTGDQWHLTATATPFISKLRGESLSADLNYVSSDGTISNLQNGAVNIMSHTTTSDNDVVDVTNDWNSSQGLFLKVHSDAIQGKYYSGVTWTLVDGL